MKAVPNCSSRNNFIAYFRAQSKLIADWIWEQHKASKVYWANTKRKPEIMTMLLS